MACEKREGKLRISKTEYLPRLYRKVQVYTVLVIGKHTRVLGNTYSIYLYRILYIPVDTVYTQVLGTGTSTVLRVGIAIRSSYDTSIPVLVL